MSTTVTVKVTNVEDQAPLVFSNVRDDGALLKSGQVCLEGYTYSIKEMQAALKAVDEGTVVTFPLNGIGRGDPFSW